jgi:hypothetical protein
MKRYVPPCLEEMGDIAPALDNLLKIQAEYARSVPGITRAMRDVARASLAAEIARYVTRHYRAADDPSLFERVFGKSHGGY